MTAPRRPIKQILGALQERAKELSCLYRAVEILSRDDRAGEPLLQEVLGVLPSGWQYPEHAQPLLLLGARSYSASDFAPTEWRLTSPVKVRGRAVGQLSIYYTREFPEADEGPFLKEERQLLNTVAERIGFFVDQRELLEPESGWESALPPREGGRNWHVMIEFLERINPRLLDWVTRKMINHLRWKGADVQSIAPEAMSPVASVDENRPIQLSLPVGAVRPHDVFAFAAGYCGNDEILGCLQMWISQEKVSFMVTALENQGSSLAETIEALDRFQHLGVNEAELPHSVQTMLRVALLRRFFTDDIDFINIAKNLVTLRDFHRLSQRLVYPADGHGRVGGKSSGLFLAQRIVEASPEFRGVLADVKVPRTWYIASDGVLAFIRYNNLEDVYDRKYMDIEQVRQQYPNVVRTFKSATFPPELVRGLAAALDDFANHPLIVRSSSLLEDRTGAVFSGKYKSLFLANQGSRHQRMQALQDAVAEVYASIFGPDPIEYRAERNLLDVHEEMGIMIQEVVGQRVGRYFLPAYAGVAFSNNEFRWSPRIRREDGLVRLVPGLGTRAVDRLTDDYPVLLAPGRPGLRANITMDEIARYSPRMVDLINLETNSFETMPIAALLRECGSDLPLVRRIVSLLEHDRVRRPSGLSLDFSTGEYVVTFEGLCTDTPFVSRMATLLRLLREQLGGPVDVEFASDGTNFFLLQCRPQSYGASTSPAAIPRDVPLERVLFSAHRYVSNGQVPEITHLVYVDPEGYAALSNVEQLRDVGRVVGRLNKLLPRRRFILIGPGRWGSRGDIRLGVNVTYSEVNNTAMLIEVARRRGNYVPDLSFGTHFFQDLVEADIRYLPLYPDESENRFNQTFFTETRNLLPELLPDFAYLADTVRVIDIPAETGGRSLRVVLNGDQDEALGFLTELRGEHGVQEVWAPRSRGAADAPAEDHVRWRTRMAERIAAEAQQASFGVLAAWLIGSTGSGTADAESDIDLLLHVDGTDEQRRDLLLWLEGWNQALTEANHARTGVRVNRFLDVRLLTTAELESRTGFASKIHAVTDRARRL